MFVSLMGISGLDLNVLMGFLPIAKVLYVFGCVKGCVKVFLENISLRNR